MPNSKRKVEDRASRRVWSEEDDAWVAPPHVPGDPESGPEKHNRHTLKNWKCGCRECKKDNARHSMDRRIRDRGNWTFRSGQAPELPSSDALSVGGGATLTG